MNIVDTRDGRMDVTKPNKVTRDNSLAGHPEIDPEGTPMWCELRERGTVFDKRTRTEHLLTASP